uniref:UV-stimulated scaffold protein A C-terminal domain-containing protein n=1 Tax=Biomphalaria glabrata TaxID=6526 RepID=A0A2C9M463_BIOGL
MELLKILIFIFFRESDDYVRYAFYLIMKQLTKNHSEIRLSAFQLADELFNRSHAFREILVLHLQQFLALTTALEVNKPLPPPSAAANKLKSETLLAIQRWYEKYGKGYRKLVHGYDYLKNCKFCFSFSSFQHALSYQLVNTKPQIHTHSAMFRQFLYYVDVFFQILSKNGGKENDIKSAIDLKIHLETIKSKCVDLKLVSMETNKNKLDDSDDDFEEVPEKEGFEPHIPPHLRAEYGLTDNVTTQAKPQLVTVSSESSSKTSTGWNLKERLTSQVAADPTTMANALAKVESQSLMSTSPKMSRQNSQETASTIPFVEFGADLACWENPDQIEVPSVIKYDSLHRFWTPKETETEKPSQHELSALKNRVFSFPGKFEPVKWKCRAPMPNGKVCERMDRIKCPFHGTIIGRDETGKPSNVTDSSEAHQKEVTVLVEQEEPSTSCCNESLELPPWQDPELQREIEHATGHDLGSARSQKLLDKATKGKGKGKKSKKSNLTNIKAIQNTTHRRLSAKVFNKRSLKKVCATLDNCDYKRIRDKFGNQFHYSLK